MELPVMGLGGGELGALGHPHSCRREGGSLGGTCFWGTCTLQPFMPQIRGTFSWVLQDHRHLWYSLPGAVAVSPFFQGQPLYLVSHPHQRGDVSAFQSWLILCFFSC